MSLFKAISDNNLILFKEIIERGCNVNEVNCYKISVLHYAVIYKRIEMVKVLLAPSKCECKRLL